MTRSDLGDGPKCPEDGRHGKLYTMGTHLWCPVTQAIFDEPRYDDEARAFVAGSLLRAGYVDPITED